LAQIGFNGVIFSPLTLLFNLVMADSKRHRPSPTTKASVLSTAAARKIWPVIPLTELGGEGNGHGVVGGCGEFVGWVVAFFVV